MPSVLTRRAVPYEAEFLFVCLDANYATDIEASVVFTELLRYHHDGAGFWQRHGVHHPFLLPGYRGDGRRYHRNFAQLGFLPQDAAQVAFVALLHVPTVGRSKLVAADLDITHLRMIDSAIRNGRARHIFLSAGVARLMRATQLFAWLPAQPHGRNAAATAVRRRTAAGLSASTSVHLWQVSGAART
ncbi:hypothetical protein [Xanthomonas sp. 3058]|uniref:hypothetical protein n=1 Tax=Xanthomonas sp. 3058 TaxID=3035314 RepID=UPI0016104F47|nr:hypothetical protein [Xanthomonas sp. 3058]MBB5866113.1 hypothetical protein [Xanthomonas sp. 3058]